MTQLFLTLLLTSLITPAAFLQKQQLDRDANGLKGKVKVVEIEISLIDESGRTESTRQRGRTEEFDAAGNLTVIKHYDPFGDVLALLTYDFVDGERVFKQEFKSKRMMVVRPGGPGNEPKHAPDPRYTAKLTYKYESNGKRTELTRTYSDGTPSTREVYAFTANQREELTYSGDGSLTRRAVYKLDDKGNEIERFGVRYDDPRGPLQGTTKFTYLEFDSQGNWTKRRETRGNDSWIIFRTITYH